MLELHTEKFALDSMSHEKLGSTDPVDNATNPHLDILSLISSQAIAPRFAETAACQLEQHEFISLVKFFKTCRQDRQSPVKNKELASILEEKLEAFYATETQLSGQDRTRLATPLGRGNSALGLILHVASHDKDATAFWDKSSTTISLLYEKGLRDDMLFGYDWHWRAERADDRGKPHCSTAAWPKQLKELHDQFSTEVASIIPMPSLVVAGACPIRSYTRSLDRSARLVEIMLFPPDGKFRFWLEFDIGGQHLKRLTLLLDHPAAIFYANQTLVRKITTCLDAGINMILWLLGQPHTTDCFLRKAFICHYTRWAPGGFEYGLKGAPLAELHAYRRQESNDGKNLPLDRYSARFLEWAAKYLGADPASVLQQGSSFVNKIQARITARICQRRANRRESAADQDKRFGAVEKRVKGKRSTSTTAQIIQPFQQVSPKDHHQLAPLNFTPDEIQQAL
ncbi:hypothetical protein BJ170DRAFT_682974 [Xylariales sp. AK1849]|nr:hypothetical protein BJ170DRAFT_682974 [Xylariales sp. AK1849]